MFVGDGARKPNEHSEARRLREAGMPYKRIATRLGVSSGSVHLWTRDIELTPEQIERNLRGPRGPQAPHLIERRVAAVRAVHRARRVAAQGDGRATARQGNALHQAGCMLYWAEGSKERNTLIFSNSDQDLIRYFWGFLQTCFGLGPQEVTIRINVYTGNGLTLSEIETHWLETLDLPRTCLRKGTVNHFPTSSSGRRKNKLPFGVCTLKVRRSTRILQHIYGAIQEYAGFEEPGWLDGPARARRRAPREARSTG